MNTKKAEVNFTALVIGIIAAGMLIFAAHEGKLKFVLIIEDYTNTQVTPLMPLILFSIFLLVVAASMKNKLAAGFWGIVGFLLGNWGMILAVISGIPSDFRKDFFKNEDAVLNAITDFGQHGEIESQLTFYIIRYILLTLFVLVVINILKKNKKYLLIQKNEVSSAGTSFILYGLILIFLPSAIYYTISYLAVGYILLLVGAIKMHRTCNDTSATNSLRLLMLSFIIGFFALILRTKSIPSDIEYNENSLLFTRISHILFMTSSVASMIGFFWFAKQKQLSNTAYHGILLVCTAFLIASLSSIFLPIYSVKVYSEYYDNPNAFPRIILEFVENMSILTALGLAIMGWEKFVSNYFYCVNQQVQN